MNIQKACPVVTRVKESGLEVLAFVHPLAGNQFVKGTIEVGEQPSIAARRELLEESGLACPLPMELLGSAPIGSDRTLWYFFLWHSAGLPDAWSHATADDYGHRFEFFWHPINLPLGESWHPIFLEAFHFISSRILGPHLSACQT